jgi:hypothetical protein
LRDLKTVSIAALSSGAHIFLKAVADSGSADLSVLQVAVKSKKNDMLDNYIASEYNNFK